GHIARQMLKQLGGIWGTQTLADKGVIPLLNKFAKGRTLNADAFWAELSKVSAKQLWGDPKKLARHLVDRHAVQLGMELQCPHCRQHSWFSIKDADYELNCPKCLEQFVLPSH